MNLRFRLAMLALTSVLLVGSVLLFQLSIHISNVEATTLDGVFDSLTASIERISARKHAAAKKNPFEGTKLYVDPDSLAMRQYEAWKFSRPKDAALMRKVASGSQAIWFGDWNGEDVSAEAHDMLTPVWKAGALPVVVAYNMPNRDCGEYSAGGAATGAAYMKWISSLNKGIGRRGAIIILEPDGISEFDCMSEKEANEHLKLLFDAVHLFKKNRNNYVYIDAGNPQWIKAEDMAGRLKKANIAEADGFALNISNFLTDQANIAYGEKISALTGGKHFVIDTSRNGRGPDAHYEWCNPPGRALGRLPTAKTGNPLVDAFLWVKLPGESDGECNGGPHAGMWWPEYALGLAQRARW